MPAGPWHHPSFAVEGCDEVIGGFTRAREMVRVARRAVRFEEEENEHAAAIEKRTFISTPPVAEPFVSL